MCENSNGWIKGRISLRFLGRFASHTVDGNLLYGSGRKKILISCEFTNLNVNRLSFIGSNMGLVNVRLN